MNSELTHILPDPATAQSVGWMLLVLFCILAGINQALRLLDRFRGQLSQYADKDETELRLNLLDRQVQELRAEADKRFDALERKMEASYLKTVSKLEEQARVEELRSEKIHARINQILEVVSRISGTCEAIQKRKDLQP